MPTFSCDVTILASDSGSGRVHVGLTDLAGSFSDRKFLFPQEQSREMLAIGLAALVNYRRLYVVLETPNNEWSEVRLLGMLR
jgi:hypothetical protein